MGNLIPKDHAKSSRNPTERTPQPLSTDNLLDEIDTKLTSLKKSVTAIKGRNAKEAQEELSKIMTETQRDIHYLNQQIEPQQKREGKSTFYMDLPSNQNESGTENLVQTLLSKIDNLQRDNENLSAMFKEEQERAEKNEAKITDLLLRLSRAAGQKLVENNPAIADLNDRNRPTKLGEIYSELYDNEWTDALDGLQEQGHDEEFAIETLKLTLVNVYDFCKQKADTMLLKTEDAVNFLFEEYKLMQEAEKVSSLSVPNEAAVNQQMDELHERWKLKSQSEQSRLSRTLMVEKSDTVSSHVKVLRKETAESMVPVVQRAYIKTNWRKGEFVPALKPFIRKCIFLCWMTAVQSPPMCLHLVELTKDAKFDQNMYKDYTVRGPMVKFVTWPALLLHENGPVVCKGVAQGCDKAN